MRRDGIPYVQNPKGYYPPIDINKLSLEEIRQKFIKTCGKANGDISVCSKCPTPCAEGKRAIQLSLNKVYNDPPIPLYGGKTLIERAQEENMKRRAAQAEKEANVLRAEEPEKNTSESKTEEKPKKRKYQKMDDWWDKSLQAEDQIAWIMETFGVSKTQAKKKVYSYKYAHGLVGPTVKTPDVEQTPKPEVKEEVVKAPTDHSNDIVFKVMESKIDDLMRTMDDYKKKYEEYKKLYDDISEQVDTLCKALDVFEKTNK